MASRFPIEEAPDGSAKEIIEEALEKMHGGGPPPFKWIEDDGRSLLGMYAPLSFTPNIAQSFFDTATIVYGNVNPRIRELAILGLFSVLDAPYAVYCHRQIAPKVGLTVAQYDDGLSGKPPRDLAEKEVMAYKLGRHLTTITGPLDDEMWKEATSKMERAEFLGVVHCIAGYRWVALLEQVGGADRRRRSPQEVTSEF